VDRRTARALAAAGPLDHDVLGGVVGPVVRCVGDALGGAHGGAGRGVDLRIVVELDDLGRLEPRGGELREAHHEHGPDGEVRRDEARALREGARQRLEVGRGEARGADDRVQAVLSREREVLAGGVGDGEVDDDLRPRVEERLG
jgi:hypothetical protein